MNGSGKMRGSNRVACIYTRPSAVLYQYSPCSLKSSGCPKGQPGSSATAVRHCCPCERAGFVPETT